MWRVAQQCFPLGTIREVRCITSVRGKSTIRNAKIRGPHRYRLGGGRSKLVRKGYFECQGAPLHQGTHALALPFRHLSKDIFEENRG